MFPDELQIKTCDISMQMLSQIKKFDRIAELGGKHKNSAQNIVQFSRPIGSANRHTADSQLPHYKPCAVNCTTVCTMHSAEERARNCNAE